jgi:hypothetical protein
MQTASLSGILTTALTATILASACASGPRSADEQDEAEYREVDGKLTAAEQFELRKTACIEAGGVLQVQRSAGRWQPRPTEMSRATCMRRPGGEY